MNSAATDYWAIIPAAGVGKRMQSDCPKQYLLLDEFSILYHTLSIFINHSQISGIVVAISDGDEYWPETYSQLNTSDKPILVAPGGKERSDSVLSALNYLNEYRDQQDCQVLVHDAARPCLLAKDIDNLIEELNEHAVGGLLGIPVVDTLKRCGNNNQVIATVDRQQIWRALTPQCFSLHLLIKALSDAYQGGKQDQITDESSAIELLGLKPKMVEGDSHNIKVTLPQDLQDARLFINEKSISRNRTNHD